MFLIRLHFTELKWILIGKSFEFYCERVFSVKLKSLAALIAFNFLMWL